MVSSPFHTFLVFIILLHQGYRKIWAIIKLRGIPVNQKTVMEIVRELNPDGVKARKKKRLKRRVYTVPGMTFSSITKLGLKKLRSVFLGTSKNISGTAHKISGTVHKILGTVHKILGTTHKILGTAHKFKNCALHYENCTVNLQHHRKYAIE